jgi:hypothetical protein
MTPAETTLRAREEGSTGCERFRQLFRAHPDAHYVRDSEQYGAVEHGVTVGDIERHLRGEEPSLLSVPILPNGFCFFFGAIDVDRHKDDDAAVDLAVLAEQVSWLGLPLIV